MNQIKKIFNLKTFNHISIFILILILIILFLIYSKKFNSKKINKVDINNISQNINYFKSYIKNNKINISNRYVFVGDNEIIFGNNLKQVQNGYFDIKIYMENEQKISIEINKLYKEKFNDDMYEDDYVDNIVNIINDVFNFKLSSDEINYFKENIIKYYIDLRRNYVENVENLSNINIKSYNINFEIEKSMLILNIFK